MTRRYDSSQLLSEIEKNLLEDERLLWIGKPSIRRQLMIPRDGVEPVVSLIIGLIVTIVMTIILFIGIGEVINWMSLLLVMLFGFVALIPILGSYATAKNTTYIVTTYRAIIVKNGKVTSFGSGDIDKLEHNMEQDGTGDIIFKSVVRERFIPNGHMAYPIEVEEKIGFYGIAKPHHVYGLLLNTFRTSPITFWQDAAPLTVAGSVPVHA